MSEESRILLETTPEVQELSNQISDDASIVAFGQAMVDKIIGISEELFSCLLNMDCSTTIDMLKKLSGMMKKIRIGNIPGFFMPIYIKGICSQYNSFCHEFERVEHDIKRYQSDIRQKNLFLERKSEENFRCYQLLEKHIAAGQICSKNSSVSHQKMEERIEVFYQAVSIARQNETILGMMISENWEIHQVIQESFLLTIPALKKNMAQYVLTQRNKQVNKMTSVHQRSLLSAGNRSASDFTVDSVKKMQNTILAGINQANQLYDRQAKVRMEHMDLIQRIRTEKFSIN